MTMPLSAIVFLVALFAETNRLPFDMAEGEADLFADLLMGNRTIMIYFGWTSGTPTVEEGEFCAARWLDQSQIPISAPRS